MGIFHLSRPHQAAPRARLMTRAGRPNGSVVTSAELCGGQSPRRPTTGATAPGQTKGRPAGRAGASRARAKQTFPCPMCRAGRVERALARGPSAMAPSSHQSAALAIGPSAALFGVCLRALALARLTRLAGWRRSGVAVIKLSLIVLVRWGWRIIILLLSSSFKCKQICVRARL